MSVTIKTVEKVIIVELAGRIDIQATPEIKEQLLPLIQPGSKIILDMTQVTYIASVGLRMLVTTYRHISGVGGSMVLVGLLKRVRDTMSITGFLRYFAIYDTIEAGLAALQDE